MEYIVIGALVLAALTAVAFPLFRKSPTDAVLRDDGALEQMISAYRAALKSGSVCDRCLKDNPEGSNYCAECGAAFGRATAS